MLKFCVLFYYVKSFGNMTILKVEFSDKSFDHLQRMANVAGCSVEEYLDRCFTIAADMCVHMNDNQVIEYGKTLINLNNGINNIGNN